MTMTPTAIEPAPGSLTPLILTLAVGADGDQWISDPDGDRIPGTLPAAPTNLSAVESTSSSVTVAWSYTGTGHTGFKTSYWRAGIDQQWQTGSTLTASARTWTSSAMPAGTNIGIRVVAYNAAGNSPPAEAWRYTEAGVIIPLPTYAQRTHTVTATATGSGTGTDASPWTLTQALASAQPGMIIGVKAGIYVGSDPLPGQPLHDGNQNTDSLRRFYGGFKATISGTAEQPIHIVAETPAALTTDPNLWCWLRSGALLEGRGWGAFSFHGSYIHLIGFYVSDLDCTDSTASNDSGRIIAWGDFHDCSVRYCRFRRSRKHMDWQDNNFTGVPNNDSDLRLEICHDFVIADNDFQSEWTGYKNNQPYLMMYQTHHHIVEHNLFTDGTNCFFQKRGFAASSFNGITLKGIRFRYNIARGVAASCYIAGLRDDGPPESERSHYYCNLFIDPRDEVFKFNTDNFSDFCHDGMRIYNNTIVNQAGSGYALADIQSMSFATLYDNAYSPDERINVWANNAITSCANYAHLGYDTHGGDVVDEAWWKYFMKSQRNLYGALYHLWAGSSAALGGLLNGTWAEWQAAGGEVDSQQGINLMLDAADDYRPLPGSPCIGAGRDIYGTFGPVDAVIDAGCHVGGSPGIRPYG